jgi:hypothetical protein
MRRCSGDTCRCSDQRILTGSRWLGLVMLLSLILVCTGFQVLGRVIDVSGQFGLATIMMPVPATLEGGIQLDTPAELTLLKFGIESDLDFTMTVWDAAFHLNSAINIAGLERIITDFSVALGPIDMKLEIWSAVPFETVTDVDHFTNWVVIPPGDLMYVKTRFETSVTISSVEFDNLLMIEDVTFPNPSADFLPLQYSVQSQSFHVGDILTVSFEPYPGVNVRSVTNFCADSGSRPVKGYSASGRVDADESLCDYCCWDETLSITGLEYCGIPFWFSLTVDPTTPDVLRLSGGGSFSALGDLELSGSFSLFPFLIGGYSFSFTWCDCISASVSLTNAFALSSMSFRGSFDIPFGAMTGRFSASGAFDDTLHATSLSLGVSATQGTFSGGLNVGISQQSGDLRLSSVSANLGMTLTPVRVTFSILFGRTGLRQAMLDVGVTF